MKLSDIVDRIVYLKDKSFWVYAPKLTEFLGFIKRHRALIIDTANASSDIISQNQDTIKDCKVFSFVVYVFKEETDYAVTHALSGMIENLPDTHKFVIVAGERSLYDRLHDGVGKIIRLDTTINDPFENMAEEEPS